MGDGARWIRRVAEEHFPHATQIVDRSHAREHVWNVATAVYGSGTPDGAAWAKQADELLTHGQSEELVHMSEQLAAIPVQFGASRSIPEIEADDFLSNAQRMRYPTFRAKGMHASWQWRGLGGLQNRDLHPCQTIRGSWSDLVTQDGRAMDEYILMASEVDSRKEALLISSSFTKSDQEPRNTSIALALVPQSLIARRQTGDA